MKQHRFDKDFQSVKDAMTLMEAKELLRIPSDIAKIHKLFKKAKKQLFVVGGAVRDAILGIKPKDFDLATDATPDEMIKIAKSGGLKVVELGKEFGVIVVDGHEIATFRKDIGKGRRPDSVEYTDIAGDVKRRDLTINALFYDIDKHEIVDLTGGIKDLKDKRIRTVGKAEERFDEDPLRKLRALRFAGKLGGDMHVDIVQALKKDPSLKGVSPERIRDEFIKGVKTSKSPKLYLQMAKELKLLPLILPNLKLNTNFIDSNNILVQLSSILKDNDSKKVRNELNKLKYLKTESDTVHYFLSLLNFTPNDVMIYKKEFNRIKPDLNSMSEWGKLVNRKDEFDKLAKFELSVKGSDAPSDVTGKAIGDWIKSKEAENFKSMK